MGNERTEDGPRVTGGWAPMPSVARGWLRGSRISRIGYGNECVLGEPRRGALHV